MKNLHHGLFLLAFIFLGASSGFTQTCPTGMISYWKLQESGTTFHDSKGSINAVAASAAPVQTTGISGYAQQFAGSYITIPANSAFNWTVGQSYSLELWVKYTEVSGVEVILGRDDPVSQTHWWIGKTAAGKIEWFTKSSDGSNGDVESTGSYNNGQWHHVVAVRDGALAKHYLYVDGVLQNAGGTDVSLGGNLSSTEGLTLGNMIFDGTPNFYYNGAIDEVALYSRVLTGAEVTTHYNNAKNYQMGYCADVAPELLSNPVTTAIISEAYTYDVNASGNPLPTYSLVSAPTGMTIDQVTGVISWTPASFSSNAPVEVKITNSNGTIYQNFSIYLSDAPVCRNNLIAYWDFESGSSPIYDKIASYKLSSSDASSVPSRVAGRAGYGLNFDGSNDSLDMLDNAEPSNIFFDFDNVPNFSIELWMKSSATPENTMVLVGRNENENNTQYWLGVTSTGMVALYLRDYLETPNSIYLEGEGASVLDGKWHHIVTTYNATSNDVKVYVDKVMVASGNQNFGNFGGNDPLNVGYLYTTIDKFWYEGMLDELAFYNTALTEATITSNYDNGAAGKGACTQNFAPLIISEPVTAATEDAAYSYKLIASDLKENDIVSITAVTKPAWLSLAYTAGDTIATLSGTPTNANVGNNAVTLRVSDGTITVDQTFTIVVANVNDAPQITSVPVATTNEDALYSYTVVATDADAGDQLTYSATVKPAWLTFDAATHVLSGTPTNDNVGVFDITVRVSDGTANADQSYQLTVNNVNDAPVITSTAIETVHANETYMYEITATDVDGDELTFTADSKPAWLSFTPASTSAILMGVPALADQGTHAIILKVSDGTTEVMQGFTLTVTAPSGIDDLDNSIVNNVYPNPAKDFVYFKLDKNHKSRIEILDIAGNLRKVLESENQDLLKVDLTGMTNGLYIYKVHQDGKIGIGKISKN